MKLSRHAIRETLAAAGPMTASELARFFPDASPANVSAQIYRMRRLTTPQVHIAAWTRDDGIGKTYLRAVFAEGDKPDARKPKRFSGAERTRRSRERRKIPKAANSVFTWAAQP